MRAGLWMVGVIGLALCPGAAAHARRSTAPARPWLAGPNCYAATPTPMAPAQSCNFSWTLMSSGNQQSVVNGSFVLAPGVQNSIVYQGSGYAYALAMPVVLCQGRSDTPPG